MKKACQKYSIDRVKCLLLQKTKSMLWRILLVIFLTALIYFTILAIQDVYRTGKNRWLIPLIFLTLGIGAIIYFLTKQKGDNENTLNF